MADSIESIVNGSWKIVGTGSIEEIRDKAGFTHPNLHRKKSVNTENRNISVGIYGLDSYRTTETVVHNENSRDSEIP
ncbi:MAG: hypothetical protein NC320_03225 [Clostridium sp.]|nr:hypothetical protein [Clostridium sp.]